MEKNKFVRDDANKMTLSSSLVNDGSGSAELSSLEKIKPYAEMLGTLFYFGPFSLEAEAIIQAIAAGEISKKVAGTPSHRWKEAYEIEGLEDAWDSVFLGHNTVDAPPWASVYLDPKKGQNSQSLLALHKFITKHKLHKRFKKVVAEDQIGLLLLYVVMLLEQKKFEETKTLLEGYFLPWVFCYLECLTSYSPHPFISELAFYSQCTFKCWIKTYNLEPNYVDLHWPQTTLSSSLDPAF